MSTRIYNGFVLRGTRLNIEKVHQLVMDWRKELEVLHVEAINRFVANIAIDVHDHVDAGMKDPTDIDSPLHYAIGELWRRQDEIKKTNQRDPLVDFDFELVLIPYADRVYGIAYTDQREWLDLWRAKPYVADFSYWNNSDKPDEISDEEWDHRQKVWETIVDYNPPSICGFTVQCTSPHTRYGIYEQKEAILQHIPSFEARVTSLAKNIVHHKAMQERRPADEKEYEAKFWEVFTAANKWMKTDEGKAALEAEKTRLATVLKPEITIEDLKGRA